MSVIKKVDLSKSIENFADKQGEALFKWAEQTWHGFVEKVLQLMQRNDNVDHNFTLICNQLAKVHSASVPEQHAEKLKDWAALVRFPLSDIKDWEAGKNLPQCVDRESIVEQMLQALAGHIRGVDVNTFIFSMVHVVNVTDSRQENKYSIVTVSCHGRSVHQLGLEQRVVDILYNNDLKTVGELNHFVTPPPSGGLVFDRKRPPSRPKFDPVKKLQTLKGIDKESAEKILHTVRRWTGSFMNPASIYL